MPAARPLRRAPLLALPMLLFATPALAHPYFHGGEAPADSLATLTLDLAHGCGDEAGGSDTVEVALLLPDEVTYVDPHEVDGWTIEVERDDGGRIEVVSWLEEGGAEPAPTFDLDLVVTGQPGDEVWFGVFQNCVEGSHRWVGTPDEPADDPAVRLTLTDPDPDSPPPSPTPTPPAATDDDVAPTPTPTPEPTPAAQDPDDLATAEPDEGGFPWLATLLLVLVVAGIGAALAARNRRSAT